ncbi:MAG: sodium/proton-translocating pyrophosphatase, partial [Nannocystaceae bacterium]
MQQLFYLVPAAGVIALAYAVITAGWVGKQDAGTTRMKNIGEQIYRGAMAFLAAEYKVLAIFVLFVAALLSYMYSTIEGGSWMVGLAFLAGAVCSGLAGYFGMRVATRANVRTAAAARIGLAPALTIAFRGGAVMGMCVVGLALLGFGLLFNVFLADFDVFGLIAAN